VSADHEPSWRAGDGVVLRTPLLPATTLVEWANAPDPRVYVANLLSQPAIEEAIFVASPSLHASLATWRENPGSAAGRRAEHSLAKYVARMAVRATPFGLFSGVSVGSLARETRLELAPRAEYRRRTRLDNDYLFVLADELARLPENRQRLVFRPNTSLYPTAGRLRYAATEVAGKERRYQLVAVEPTPYLEATLARARDGARLRDLAAALVDSEITADEASTFVDELVNAQLLVPDLGIHVTGPEPIDGMLAQLRAATLEREAEVLAEARAGIRELDGAGLGNSPERYRAIERTLSALPAKVELARLFQVDMVKPAALGIGRRIAADLARVIGQLARLHRDDPTSLNDFSRAFRDRWEDREIPLAQALDEESGIGFESARGPGSEGAPLLADLYFPGGPPDARASWTPQHRHMLRRLGAALVAGADEIVLTDADFDAMAVDPHVRVADALAAIVRLVGSAEEIARGEPTLVLEGFSGPSGANLLGRFCHASPELETHVRAHLAAEEALTPDALFAEIVHLNEGRMGNILCRPVLRAYEITYLGMSGAPRDRQLLLEDLLVSLRGDRIVLRSRQLDREVIPRLTTAHNFRLRSLCVYRFLCALARQHGTGAGWSWGVLGDSPYLPRVRTGRIVLAPAQWVLDEADLQPITRAVREASRKGDVANVATAVQALRASRRLPRMFVIADGDNELPVDLDNPMLAAAFADEVSGRKAAMLRELLPSLDRLPVHGPEGGFSNEVILTFTRAPDPAAAAKGDAPAPRTASVERTFTPGGEWLYAKLYCGESTGDRVLRDAIAPVIRDVHGDRPWFFLRYQDPDTHVRVRFHGDPAQLVGEVMPALERSAAPLVAAGIVQRLVLDTYQREVERYGGARGIDLIEEIFWRDSEAVLGIVELLDGDAGADARWRLAVRGIDSLLEAIGLDAEQRAKVVTQGRDMLGREMRVDTPLWTRIGERFTKERASLDLLFARDPARDADHDLMPGFELLATRDARVHEIALKLRQREDAGELTSRILDMAWSVVHMHANRLLHASQRAQELVLYDFLRRLHAARRARAGGR
jgi:thiopeptide-type bacteriocin biosynthesis protein